jgi:hypothetical protein
VTTTLHNRFGYTVGVYFPPQAPEDVIEAFFDRVTSDAYSIDRGAWDAFVVGLAGDQLGVEDPTPADRAVDSVNTITCQIADLVEAGNVIEGLAVLRLLNDLVNRYIPIAAQAASDRDYTWVQIGEALGLSKQTVWTRYAKGQTKEAVSPEVQECLVRMVQAVGGEWDTRRVMAVLDVAGHTVTTQVARRALRGVVSSGLLERVGTQWGRYQVVAKKSARETAVEAGGNG